MQFSVDPWKRIQFYVDHGLVESLPNPEQLKRATCENDYGAGFIERIRYYARRPQDMLPTRRKAELFAMNNEDIVAKGYDAALNPEGAEGADESYWQAQRELPFVDRTLKRAFLFSPLRFGVMTLYNPWNAVPGTGLEIPARFLVSHVVHAHHPTALWDVQVLHPMKARSTCWSGRLTALRKGRVSPLGSTARWCTVRATMTICVSSSRGSGSLTTQTLRPASTRCWRTWSTFSTTRVRSDDGVTPCHRLLTQRRFVGDEHNAVSGQPMGGNGRVGCQTVGNGGFPSRTCICNGVYALKCHQWSVSGVGLDSSPRTPGRNVTRTSGSHAVCGHERCAHGLCLERWVSTDRQAIGAVAS
jgi:hypothetical protein